MRLGSVAAGAGRQCAPAAVALANRLARIVWATWKYERAFDGNWGNQTG